MVKALRSYLRAFRAYGSRGLWVQVFLASAYTHGLGRPSHCGWAAPKPGERSPPSQAVRPWEALSVLCFLPLSPPVPCRGGLVPPRPPRRAPGKS